MKAVAIVYVSKHGHTKRYAEILGEKTGLKVYALSEARKTLSPSTPVIFMSWIHATRVVDYKKASRFFAVEAVCAIGLCDTGTLLSEVRKATVISDDIPLFTVQGGMDTSTLKGLDKLLISMLVKGLSSQKERSAQDERTLELLQNGEDYVSEDNLSSVLSWLLENK